MAYALCCSAVHLAVLTCFMTEIRITEHTELGDNSTIKSPPPIVSSRSSRKRVKYVLALALFFGSLI